MWLIMSQTFFDTHTR